MNSINQNTTLIELAGIICQHLQMKGIQVSLVGGAVVTFYTDNKYQSRDLDFISPNDHKQITDAMAELGFTPKGKDFYHPRTQFTVEFPSGPLAIGNSIPVKAEGEYETAAGVIHLFSPTQCVMDRLAWFYHYKDRQCLDQAISVAKKHPVNLAQIKKWSQEEGAIEQFEFFKSRL